MSTVHAGSRLRAIGILLSVSDVSASVVGLRKSGPGWGDMLKWAWQHLWRKWIGSVRRSREHTWRQRTVHGEDVRAQQGHVGLTQDSYLAVRL
jgi:hypothetical protein